MAAFGTIFEGFSISHAQILNGTETFLDALVAAVDEDTDIYGVNEGGLSPDLGSYDNEGDDQIMSTWDWFNKGEVTVQAGYVSFPLISSLTNQPISSGTVGGKNVLGIDLWHEDSMSVAPKPMILKLPSKDQHGNPADFVVGLYKVQFKPIQFDGPAYRDGLKINYDGTALMSKFDETGAAFPDGKGRVGRLLAVER